MSDKVKALLNNESNETSTEEISYVETPVEEALVEGILVEEVPAEEISAEEASVEETPAEEVSVEETPVEEISVEETSAEEIPVEETPVEEIPVEEPPVEEIPVEETPVEEDNKVVIATGDVVGKTCSFCKTTIREGDEIIVCPACEQPHHTDCWEENKGCSTFGCEYQNIVGKQEKKRFCISCGAELGAEDVFCTKCGRRQEQNDIPATQTSSAVPVAQATSTVSKPSNPASFTQRVDNSSASEQPKAKKKKSLIVIVVILLIAAVAGYFGYNQYQTKLVNEYMANVQAFETAVYSSGVKLEEIGKEELSCWYDYIWDNGYYYKKYYSIEDAVSTAQSNQSYNISQVKSDDSKIRDLYSSIVSSPIANSKKSYVTTKVEDVYDDYQEMYDSILDPEGNYSTFKSTYNSCDSNLADSLKDLSDVI